ncbi:uncharacterized protein LOC130901474 [Diorhabda carinulata]|uniref:uncharacterized protein LOC130901474 n=1 Tax=Diorhabda carinulata TaxID=1163345 RepID=UPI0025A095A0|nr:uncharacterized protein LOC130901474 [Diorhabda carinulata]
MMESGDYKRRHRKDEKDYRRDRNKKRHHRHKDREGKVDNSPYNEKGAINDDDYHHRKKNRVENSRHKHKDNDQIHPNEKKDYKLRKESRENSSVDQRYLEKSNKSNKTDYVRSINNIYYTSRGQSSLRKYKTFHLGQTGHASRSTDIGEQKELTSKRRTRSEKKSKENKVSQIWYCQIDTTVPFKQYERSEERPETVPKKNDKTTRIKRRPKSSPVKKVDSEFYLCPSFSELRKSHHLRKEEKHENVLAISKQDISKKIEEEYTKKIENNLKTYLSKIERMIDKKLNDYLQIKNTKLREAIDDNMKFIERERNKNQNESNDVEKRSKIGKISNKYILPCEEISERRRCHSLTKAHRISGLKVTGKSHQPVPDIIPIEERHDYIRHQDELRTIKKESRHRAKEKRMDRSPMYHEKKDKHYDYSELNFEKGYLRGDIRTNEDKVKRIKKSKVKTQNFEMLDHSTGIGLTTPSIDKHLNENGRLTNKCMKQEIISPYEPDHSWMVVSEDHRMEKRNAKLQRNTNPPKQSPNRDPSTSIVYFKPTFSKKNIPSFSVYEKDSSNSDFFTRRTNDNKAEEHFLSHQRFSREFGDVSHKKNNFIVEGIEPAKRLVPSSTKSSKKKHPRNLECKTVSVITIPSQDQGKKYFSLGNTKGDTTENSNKMKRLKLYYQYSLDSNKCSGTTFSEEKSVVSESVKIFSDYSDQNTTTSNCQKDAVNCFENLLQSNFENHLNESGDTTMKQPFIRPIINNIRGNYNKTDIHVKSEVRLQSKTDTHESNIGKDGQAPNKEEQDKKTGKLQEGTAIFNVEILKSALQAHKDIDGCESPNNQILKCIENMYYLFVSTLPQHYLIGENTDDQKETKNDSLDKQIKGENVGDQKVSKNDSLDKQIKDENTSDRKESKNNSIDKHNIVEKEDVLEQSKKATPPEQDGGPEMRNVDTSYHEFADEQVSKVDQITSYHVTCEEASSKCQLPEKEHIVKTTDQVTSYHELFEQFNKEINTSKEQLVDQMSSYHEVVDKAAGKDFKSMEIMAVLDAVNYAISKSVTAITKDVEDLGKKKQLELEATEGEIIKIFDTEKHSVDVQTVEEEDKFTKSNIKEKFIQTREKCPKIIYETTSTSTENMKKTQRLKRKQNSDKLTKLKSDCNNIKTVPALELDKNQIESTGKEKLKEINKNKLVSNTDTIETTKTRQKNSIKNKNIEKTSLISKIPKKIKQNSAPPKQSSIIIHYPLKKSQSEISLRQLKTDRGRGRISSLICLHRYMNDVNFPDSSISCMDNFYLGRSVNNEQHANSRLFLTKDYRPSNMSSYQRRKIYDEGIRNKMRKKTLTQDKKVGQVFEVRYITVDKNENKNEILKKISENAIDDNVHQSFHNFVEETMDLLNNKDSLNVFDFIQENVNSDKIFKIIALFKKVLSSAKEKTKLKKCSCIDFINFFKELNVYLRESTIKLNNSEISTLPRNSDTYTISKKSAITEQSSNPTINSSSDFLYNDDDDDDDEVHLKTPLNPILGFAFRSDATFKKTEVGSFVDSQISEESGYISSGRSKYNLSFSNFFKNPVISQLLKPQGEYFFEDDSKLNQKQNKSSQFIKSDIPACSAEEIPVKVDSSTTTNDDLPKDTTTKSQNDHEISINGSYSDISEEDSPPQFLLIKNSLSTLGDRKSISEINIRPKSSDGNYPRRVKSETFLKNKTHILNTVEYVNERGEVIYSQSMQMYTEIIENNCKEDVLIMKRLLDSGVYLTATNFNTGCITLIVDTSQQESKRNEYNHYDVNSCNNSLDVMMLTTQKFFENLLRVYERESVIGSSLFDDKEFVENELYSSVHNNKIYPLRNRFAKRMRIFIRKIFSNRSKIMNRDVIAGYEEKGLPLDEFYQIHFQILADYAIQHFSSLIETLPFSLDKNVELHICGFFTLLKRIKNGQFVFIKVDEEINIEDNVKNQTKEAFRNIYLSAYDEARKYHRKLSKNDMNLIGAFVCKYRIGLLSRIDLITSYLGRGFFESESELKAAVIYVMKVLTSIIELEDFENYCKNNDLPAEK